ncbi:MAG: hypothetical protein KDE45_10065, partial [Caldilineaceae bacterium]|nr:hypothetical protein [Caldilineaceae bacterium]
MFFDSSMVRCACSLEDCSIVSILNYLCGRVCTIAIIQGSVVEEPVLPLSARAVGLAIDKLERRPCRVDSSDLDIHQ